MASAASNNSISFLRAYGRLWVPCRVAQGTPLGWTASNSVIVPLWAVWPGGGAVARTCIVVQRRFPPLYREQSSDGAYLRRTPRAKAAADSCLESGMQQVLRARATELRLENSWAR